MFNAAILSLQPGQTLFKGKYRIDALISASGYTSLYRTVSTSLLPVRMLRVVQREATDNGAAVFSEYQRRFQTEVKLGQMISHPNIVQVYGLDKDMDTLVLVMEYAAGGSLAERLQALSQHGKLMSVQDCVRIILEAADALAAIHAVDIIHRNIKPSRILFDGNGRVKLADLGLAQMPGEPITRMKLRQSTLPHPGTPAYMSPEQKTLSKYISPASDVYALGLVLFEMLTGHVYRNVRPGIPAAKLRTETPGWLNELLARMLDEDANRRPWDGAEVGRLLREHPMSDVSPSTVDNGGNTNTPALMPITVSTPAASVAPSAQFAAQRPPPARPTPSYLTTEDAPLRGGKKPPRGRMGLAILIILILCGALSVGTGYLILQGGLTFGPFIAMTQAAGTAEFLSRTIEPTRPRLKVTASAITTAPVINSGPVPTATLPASFLLTPAPGVSIAFARVAAGDFLMGSSDADPQAEANEKPQHTVNLPEFYVSKYEITNEQFAVFVSSTGYTPTAWLLVKTTGKQNHPASPISWDDATAFCAWVSRTTGRNVQLPTEAQWEKAARGPSTSSGSTSSGSTGGRLYPWGNQPPSSTMLNYDMQVKDTSPVGAYSPRSDSPYGAADMAGNVWEWTTTLYSDANGQPYRYPYDPNDGRELSTTSTVAYHVLRGGSYLNDGSYVRSAFRGADESTQAQKGYGFRVVVLP